MEYIHVKNIGKFHPGYKDRNLCWAKIYFRMVQGDPDCEMIKNEIDWGRLVKFIILELQAKKPLPNFDPYFASNGFDLKKRPMRLTLEALQNFLVVGTQLLENCVLEKKREDKIESCVTEEIITSVLTYLNKKAGKGFKTFKESNRKFVRGRLGDKYTEDDMKKVVDIKCNQWLGTDAAKYLRPETLFNATKFESYINEIDKSPEPKEMEDLV